MKSIQVTITATGQTIVKTLGFAGPECRKADEFLVRALGHAVREERTSEFYSVADQRHSQHTCS